MEFNSGFKGLNFVKILQWKPSCSMRTETDMTKLIVGLRNFTNAPKNTPDNCNMGAGELCTYGWNSTTAPVRDRSACSSDPTVRVSSLSCC